jgi:hypothetical protein
MDHGPHRVGAAVEWVVALAFLLATILVAVLIIREMRAVRTPPPAPPPATAPSGPPADLSTHSISVPSLLLLDGGQVRVGDTLEQVTAALGPASQVGTDTIGRARLGDRITRSFDHAGTRFVLVFEPFERNGPPRVTAIYLR